MIFYGLDNDGSEIPLITVDQTSLTGGRDGTSPYVVVERVQAMTNKPFFDTIQGDMLFTSSTTASVLVKVGPHKLTSSCRTNCEYTTNADLNEVLSSFSLSGTELTFAFQAETVLDGKSFSVWYAG